MAGIERYEEHEQAVPGGNRRNASYHVRPMDLSAGLSIGSAERVGQAAGAGLRELARTGRVIGDIAVRNAELNRKIQMEKDELFGDRFRREYQAELKALPVTLDREKDEAAVESIRKKYGEILDQEQTISDNFRKRAGSVLEADFSVYNIGMAGERSRTAVKRNAEQLKGYMDEAIGFGDTEKALMYRSRLEQKGIAVAPEEAVRSACSLNGVLNELPVMELTELERDLRMVKDAFKEKRGFLGMNGDHTRRYYRALQGALAKKEYNEIQKFNSGLVNGTLEITQHDLDLKKGSGLLNDRMYLAMSASVQARDKEMARIANEKERKERAAKQRADAVNQSKFELYVKTLDFSSVPEENIIQKKMAVDTLLKSFPGDYKYQARMLDYIDKRSGEVELQRKIFSTPQGKIAKKWLEDNYKNMVYDPVGLWNKEDGDEFKRSRYAQASDYLADLLKQGKSADEAIRIVEEQVKRMNDGEIYHLYRYKTQVKAPKGKRITTADIEKDRDDTNMASMLGFYVPPPDRSNDINTDDIVSKKYNELGREMWKLKDGRTVYADEYK